MWYRLAPIIIRVDDDPIPRVRQTLPLRDALTGEQQVSSRVAGFTIQPFQALDVLLRDHEQMSGGLGIDVANRDPARFIVDEVRLDHTVDDLAEKAVAHLVICPLSGFQPLSSLHLSRPSATSRFRRGTPARRPKLDMIRGNAGARGTRGQGAQKTGPGRGRPRVSPPTKPTLRPTPVASMAGRSGSRVFSRNPRPYVRARAPEREVLPCHRMNRSPSIPPDEGMTTTPEQDNTREQGEPAGRRESSDRHPDSNEQQSFGGDAPESDRHDAGRPRIIKAELDVDQRSNAIIRVCLQRGPREATVETEAVGEEMVGLRRAAEATLQALHEILDLPDHFELVGVKRILAFDSPIILVGLRMSTGRPRTLIGSLPAGENLTRTVVEAVLSATNRLVEALPDTDSSQESVDTGNPEDEEQ